MCYEHCVHGLNVTLGRCAVYFVFSVIGGAGSLFYKIIVLFFLVTRITSEDFKSLDTLWMK